MNKEEVNKVTKEEIREEIREAEHKTKEIQQGIDVQETTKNAATLKNITLIIDKKEYKLNALIEIMNKPNKTEEEYEIMKQFKELMQNYFEGIVYAISNVCCGQKYSLDKVKRKLQKEETYKLIDIRCSRRTIKFDKETVDTVIKFAEKYLI